jgi:hypothetical protein
MRSGRISRRARRRSLTTDRQASRIGGAGRQGKDCQLRLQGWSKLKNQWGGLPPAASKHAALRLRGAFNWSNLFVRLAGADPHREATTRLQGIGRQTRHAGLYYSCRRIFSKRTGGRFRRAATLCEGSRGRCAHVAQRIDGFKGGLSAHKPHQHPASRATAARDWTNDTSMALCLRRQA